MKIFMPEYKTLTKGDVDLSVFDEFGQVIKYDAASRAEIKRELADTDILLVNKNIVDADLLQNAPKLRYIGECATGYNNIDLELCRERGIRVTYVPAYSTNAVAQQVFAYILEFYNRTAGYNEFVSSGGWLSTVTKQFSRFVYDTHELAGETLGLIGYGKIGRKTAAIANAFDMNVLVYSRSSVPGTSDELCRFVTLDELLEQSDIVSVHCPLNEESEHMCNEAFFSKMKEGAYFINTARGPIVDECALKNALSGGRLAGAALDVLTYEPMHSDCPLLGEPKCIITPHVAWAPVETRERCVSIVADNLRAFLAGEQKNVIA